MDAEESSCTIMVDDKSLAVKKIVVDDSKLIYKALESKKAKLSVRIFRRFKQELYDFSHSLIRTYIRRLIMIYDYMKWGNKRTS